MYMRKAFIFILSLTVMGLNANAEGRLTLSLQQAKEYAVDHNRTIQNASIDVQKAQASRWQAIASILPQVNGSVDYSNYFGYKMDLGNFKISMPPYASIGITTSMGFNGAAIVGIQLAGISRKMADISLLKSEKDIRDQVETIYFSVLATEESVSLLERNLESMQQLYDMSLKSVEVGMAEQTDADQLKVQVATMQNTVEATRRSLEMLYNSLRIYLCVDEQTEIVLTDGIEDIMNVGYASELLGENFDIENNYDWQLLKQSTDLAKKQIAMTGLSYGPTISVYHQYNSKKYFSDEATMNMTPPNMMGVQLSLPIFTSGKATAARKDAVLAYKKQRNTLEDTELALNVQYRQCIYNLRSAIEKFEVQKQSVDVAGRVFDNIAKKYQYGVASAMDVTNSGTSLISAQSNYVQALLEIINARISLEKLLNK